MNSFLNVYWNGNEYKGETEETTHNITRVALGNKCTVSIKSCELRGTVTSIAEVQINGTCVPSRCEDYYNSWYHSNCSNSTQRQLHQAVYYMTVHTRVRALISPSLPLNVRICTYSPECNYFMWHSKDTGRHSLITTRSHCEPRVT